MPLLDAQPEGALDRGVTPIRKFRDLRIDPSMKHLTLVEHFIVIKR